MNYEKAIGTKYYSNFYEDKIDSQYTKKTKFLQNGIPIIYIIFNLHWAIAS